MEAKRMYAGAMRTEAGIARKKACVKFYNRTAAGRWSLLKSNPRKIEVGITREQHARLLTKPCHYCGGKLEETGTGLDRLDHTRGYVRGNVVPCCGVCNTIKGLLERFGIERVRRVVTLWEQFSA